MTNTVELGPIDNPNVTLEENNDGEPVLRHEPSGATFEYDSTEGEWVLGSLSAEHISLTNSFVESGDVVPFISANGVAKQSVSTSSQDYQEDREFVAARVRWDDIFNENHQIAVGASFRVPQDSGNVDVRIRNATATETIVEGVNLNSGGDGNHFLGFIDYDPPDIGSTDLVWLEYASVDGSEISVSDGLLYIGPRL